MTIFKDVASILANDFAEAEKYQSLLRKYEVTSPKELGSKKASFIDEAKATVSPEALRKLLKEEKDDDDEKKEKHNDEEDDTSLIKKLIKKDCMKEEGLDETAPATTPTKTAVYSATPRKPTSALDTIRQKKTALQKGADKLTTKKTILEEPLDEISADMAKRYLDKAGDSYTGLANDAENLLKQYHNQSTYPDWKAANDKKKSRALGIDRAVERIGGTPDEKLMAKIKAKTKHDPKLQAMLDGSKDWEDYTQKLKQFNINEAVTHRAKSWDEYADHLNRLEGDGFKFASHKIFRYGDGHTHVTVFMHPEKEAWKEDDGIHTIVYSTDRMNEPGPVTEAKKTPASNRNAERRAKPYWLDRDNDEEEIKIEPKKEEPKKVDEAAYSKSAVQKAIDRDPSIGGKEAKLIHRILKGRQVEDEPTPPSMKPEIPKQQIEHIVNKLHVSTSEAEVQKMIEDRIGTDKRWTPALKKAAVNHAIRHHRKNIKLYNKVTGGLYEAVNKKIRPGAKIETTMGVKQTGIISANRFDWKESTDGTYKAPEKGYHPVIWDDGTKGYHHEHHFKVTG